MNKIKIIHDTSANKVEADVNKFIEHKTVIDIQYSSSNNEYSVCIYYSEELPRDLKYVKGVREVEVQI